MLVLVNLPFSFILACFLLNEWMFASHNLLALFCLNKYNTKKKRVKAKMLKNGFLSK